MITENQIYWITRLDEIKGMCAGISILSAILLTVVVVTYFVFTIDEETFPRCLRRALILLATVFFAGVVGFVLTPSTKEMAMIKVIPKIVNSEFVQKDLPADAKKVYDLGKQALVEKLKEQK